MKKVIWPEGSFAPAAPKGAGRYGSFSEFLAKADARREEQELAQEYLVKALPAMVKLLEIRFTNGEPLKVMRPLRYQASVLKSSLEDDVDRAFYKSSNGGTDSFVDVVKTINPGTLLTLTSLDPHMQEFIFRDGVGAEHSISFDDRNALMTQTDVFESVRNLFEGGKLK